jgi:hypothetical protein
MIYSKIKFKNGFISSFIRRCKIIIMLAMGVFCNTHSFAIIKTFGSPPGSGSMIDEYSYSVYAGLSHYYRYATASSIYGASEFGTAGSITKFGLYRTGSTGALDSVYIFMKEVGTTTTPSTTLSLSGFTEVFRGSYPNADGSTKWEDVTLSTPFNYSGTQNLQVIIVQRRTAGGSAWNYNYISYSDGSGYGMVYHYSTSATYSNWLNTGTTTPSTQSSLYSMSYARIYARFDITPPPCTGTPDKGSAVASTTSACKGVPVVFTVKTASKPSSGISYSWDTSSSASGPWTLAHTTTAVVGEWSFDVPAGRTLYYRARAVCSVGGGIDTSSAVAVTGGTSLTPPYKEDFESSVSGENIKCASTNAKWENTSSYSWSENAYYISDYTPYCGYGFNRTPGGKKFLGTGYANGAYDDKKYFWYSPALNLKAGSMYRLSYWLANDGYNYYNPGTQAFIGTKQDEGSMNAIGSFMTYTGTKYEEYTTDFEIKTSGDYFLGINVRGTGNCESWLDDINLIELPPCNTASSLGPGGKAKASPNVICSTPGSTTLSLTGTPAYSGLLFEWERSDGAPTFASPVAAGTGMSTSTTITSGSTYYYRAKITCSASGRVTYSDTVKVSTAPITPPYTEDFETAEAGINMPCAGSNYWSDYILWTRTSPYDAPYLPGLVNHTPGGKGYLHYGYGAGYNTSGQPVYWFTPPLALTAAKAYEVSLWFSNSAYMYYSSYATVMSELGIRAGLSQSVSGMTIAAGSDTAFYTNESDKPFYKEFKRGFISPTTGVYYVGIWAKHSAYTHHGFAIDDIGISQLPPCGAKPVVGKGVASPALICNSGTSTLSIPSVSLASDLSFQWYTVDPSTGISTLIPGATLPAYTTATLSTPGAYYYKVVVTCNTIGVPNSDSSDWIKVSVGALDLPYYETFETGTAGVNVPCAAVAGTWSAGNVNYWDLRSGPYSTSYPGMKNNTPGGKMYLYSGIYNGPFYSSGDQFYWFTPALKMTANTGYKISFWYNGSGYTSGYGGTKIGVYAGTTQNASGMIYRAGAADTAINGEANRYRELVRGFVAPTTGNYYVGIKTYHVGYTYPGISIDDIGITQLPDCSGAPVAGSPDATPYMLCASGTVRLQLNGATVASKIGYQWLEAASEAGPYTPVTGGTGGTTVSHLTRTLSATTYYKCVVTCTASGISDTSKAVRVDFGYITPPYKEDFEKATPGTQLPCTKVNGTWTTSLSSYQYWTIKGAPVSSSYPINNTTPGGSQYLFAGNYAGDYYSSSTPYYWFTPAIRLEKDSTYEFKFSFLGSGYSGGSTNFSVMAGTAQTVAGMTIPVGSALTAQNTSRVKQYFGRIVSPSTANYYFGIRVNHTTYTYSGMAIDDIGLEQLPACDGTPTVGPALSSASMLCTPGTVKLSVDAGTLSKAGGLSYTWYSSTSGPTSGYALPASGKLLDPSFTSGTLSTTTWFRLVVKCESTGDSTISAPVKVDVGVIIPPYIETFEAAPVPNNVPCASYAGSWSSIYWYTYATPFNAASYPWIDNHTPGGSRYLLAGYYLGYVGIPAGGWWFSPQIKFEAGKLYQFSMWYNGSGYGAPAKTEIQVSYGASQSAAGMTTTIIPSFTDNTTIYKRIKKQFTATSSANLYLGIFVKNGPDYAYPGIVIDDIGLEEVPPCDAPVVAGTIVPNPVHICDIGGIAELDLEGATLATGLTYSFYSGNKASFVVSPSTLESTVSTLPYTTMPLSATRYYRCVVTCTATGVSDTTDIFKMGVAGFDLPYKEDFESVAVGGKPLCSDANYWGNWFYDGWRVYGALYTANYKNYTPGGKNYLIAGYYMGATSSYSPVTDNNFWYTPGFNMSTKYKYHLSFYYLASQSSYTTQGNRIGVFYGRSQTPGAMSNAIFPFTWYNNTDWELKDTTFRVPSDGIYYLGFKKGAAKAVGTDYGYYGVAFDDINLEYAPCDGMPDAGRVISSMPSGTGFCPDTRIVLEDTGATVNVVPGIKYQWYRKAVGGTAWTAIAGATGLELIGDNLMGYDYRFAVVCSNTNDTAYSNIFSVPFLPPHPTVTITPSTSPVMFCAGDSVKLTATDYPAAVYDWSNESGVLFGWKHSDINITLPGKYTVKVMSPLSACPAYTDTIEVQEIDPGYSVTITKPEDSFACAGNSILLTAISSKPGVSYTWTRDGVVIAGATSSIYSASVTGFYRVFVHDGTTTCKAGSRGIKITITDNPVATIKLPGGTATGCESEGVLLNAGNKGFSYMWMHGGKVIAGAVDSTFVAKVSGDYEVKVTNAAGCATVSSIITVTILPSPVPVITQTKIGSGIELGLTSGFLGYQWYKDGVELPAPGGLASSYLTYDPGVYRVVVKDFNGCEGEAIIDLNGVLSIEEGNTQGEIHLYPNPTTGVVFIKSPVKVKVTVSDVTGKRIIEETSATSVDLSKYADGVYLFKVEDLQGNALIQQQKVNKISVK